MDTFTRTRIIDNRLYVPLTKVIVPYSGTTTTTALLKAQGGTHKTIRDTNHPNFAARQKKGELMFSDVEIYENVGDPGVSSGTIGPYATWGTVTFSGSPMAYMELALPPWRDLFKDRDLAKANCLIKVYDKMNSSPLLGGETLKDLNKTMRMLQRPFSGALDLMARMAKSRKKALGKTAKSAARANADCWLEYRYGWTPLILDMKTIFKEAHNSSVRGTQRHVVARTSVDFSFKEENRAGQWQGTGGFYFTRMTSSLKLDTKVSAGVVYTIDNRNSAALAAKTAGMDARSIPATLWEAIPYSFVVDWFVDVGSWLQAVTPDPFIKVLGNWVTFNEQTSQSWDNTQMDVTLGPEAGLPVQRFTIGFGASKRYTRRYRRDCNCPIPLVPQLTGKDLSLLHSVDSAGLVLQRLMAALSGFKH